MVHTTAHESYEGLLVEYEVASSLFTHPMDAGRFTAALRTSLEAKLPGASVQILHDYEMSRNEWTKILEPGLYPEGPGRSMGGSAIKGSDYAYDLDKIDTEVGSAAKLAGTMFDWTGGQRVLTSGSLEKSWGGYSSFRPMRHSEQETEEDEDEDELASAAELLELAWEGK